MVIKAISGSFAEQLDPADALRNLTSTARAPDTGCKTRLRPEVVVFDVFGNQHYDVNRDGLADVDHGDVTAGIIRGRTGAKTTLVNCNDDEGGLKALDKLLQRKDVSNLYLNFSMELGPRSRERILRLAERGAQVYIGAGNESVNPLTAGPRHRNIHIVGALGGVVGSSTRSESLQTINSPHITAKANGKLQFSNVQGGVDFTGDGKADIVPRAIPHNAAGKRLATVDVTAAVIRRGNLTWDDRGSRGDAVVSVREIRRHSLLSKAMIQDVVRNSGLSVSRLDAMYMHVGNSMYRGLPGQLGFDVQVLYEVEKGSGRLQTVIQKPFSRAFSSWATPEQLSNDLIKARRCN